MPHPELSDDEAACLIAYARQIFAQERYPPAPALRPIREVLAKLDPKPKPEPLPERKPYEPSLAAEAEEAAAGAPCARHIVSLDSVHARFSARQVPRIRNKAN